MTDCPAGSVSRLMSVRASAKSTGIRISSCVACASHLPDALIHSTPPSFMDVFPVATYAPTAVRRQCVRKLPATSRFLDAEVKAKVNFRRVFYFT